jgi:hypothetical protein
MLLDGKERLWIGTDDNEVGLWSDGRFRRFGAEAGLTIGFPNPRWWWETRFCWAGNWGSQGLMASAFIPC